MLFLVTVNLFQDTCESFCFQPCVFSTLRVSSERLWKLQGWSEMSWEKSANKNTTEKSSFHVSPLRKTRWVLPRCPSKHRWRGWRGPICHSLQLGPVEMDRCTVADSGSGKLGWNDFAVDDDHLKLGGWIFFEHSRVANCGAFFFKLQARVHLLFIC